ncbi:glycoside hydrolase family 75 protein [Streptomyces sp. NPDC050658]|uniref:glycoside hydrolase family 75 protein n=1 Tax=unclassified Streptomyces TaxID=2593676 RepID=UPI00341931F1
MRTRTAALAVAAGAALLAPASLPATAQERGERAAESPEIAEPPETRESSLPRSPAREPGTAREGSVPVTAAALLARTGSCRQISRSKYRSDDGTPANIPVCGKRGAVFWKADMDIDCDGRPGKACNRRTDPLFFHATAFQQSDGRQLNAERLPYIVVPGASRRWNHVAHGIGGGSVAAVIHRGKVLYAVVGDTGPTDLIGEASYAAAKELGIRPDPKGGGTDGGVTYLVFKGRGASPIENHRAAVGRGEALARQFLRES